MRRPLVSVIVSVYNIEEYAGRRVSFAIYKILVQVIRKENGGLSDTRNIARIIHDFSPNINYTLLTLSRLALIVMSSLCIKRNSPCQP